MEPADVSQVLTIGLFDGISGLRNAADALGWNVVGHVSVECSGMAQRVVESHFPNTIHVHQVQQVDEEMIKSWSLKFSQTALVLIGGGPPCQGVSALNAARKGALKDARSSLFTHVSRIRALVAKAFPWAQVRSLMESVASMDQADEQVMSADFGAKPWRIDSADVSLAHRPRLYWLDWELHSTPDVRLEEQEPRRKAHLQATLDSKNFLEPGWVKVKDTPFPTLTTSRPRDSPGYKPAGLNSCSEDDRKRWEADRYRFPPYQYKLEHCLCNKANKLRLLSCEERETIMGYPKGYTVQCLAKAKHGSQEHKDARLTLLGNSWNVTTIAFLLSQLGELLGLNEKLSVQQIVDRTSPGCTRDFQTFLRRPLMTTKRFKDPLVNETLLVQKFLTLISLKGEDLLLQPSSEDQVRYQRLRASIPAKLWKWKTVASWDWSSCPEHINVLEMRAVLTALKWRLERQQTLHSKFVHLVDSMVVLHALSRGRSSSRKMKRTQLRINALLLATHTHVVWAYVNTKENPADAPSRRRLPRPKNAKKAS